MTLEPCFVSQYALEISSSGVQWNVCAWHFMECVCALCMHIMTCSSAKRQLMYPPSLAASPSLPGRSLGCKAKRRAVGGQGLANFAVD